MTESIQDEFASGTFMQAMAAAFMIKSFTESFTFSFSNCVLNCFLSSNTVSISISDVR